MRKCTFIIEGSEKELQMMALVLNHYADVAFPLGGSDCAAASREAIKCIADSFQHSTYLEINRRQRPILRTAVKWFYNDSEYANPNDSMLQALLGQLE